MPTSFPISLPHAPTGFVNQAALDTSITVPINDLYALIAATIGLVGDSGTSSITPSGANVITTLAVVFNKTFSAAPRVFCQFTTGITSTATCFVWPTSVTTTGFTLNINRSTTTATSVYWFAVST